jgi:hypothetical protein
MVDIAMEWRRSFVRACITPISEGQSQKDAGSSPVDSFGSPSEEPAISMKAQEALLFP